MYLHNETKHNVRINHIGMENNQLYAWNWYLKNILFNIFEVTWRVIFEGLSVQLMNAQTPCWLSLCLFDDLVFYMYLQKERDLELAARIGQSLLVKNKDLSSKNETLEEQLTLANEKVSLIHCGTAIVFNPLKPTDLDNYHLYLWEWLKQAWQFWKYLTYKSFLWKTFEGEMLMRCHTTTLLQIFCEVSLYSQVIFKSMRVADETFSRNCECQWVNAS